MLRTVVTQKDIAKRTGFSVNTVSHALRGMSDISEETREFILRTAKEMGYIMNSAASTLRSGQSGIIAVVISDISNPLFGIEVKEIEEIMQKEGFCIITFNTNENTEQERKSLNVAISKGVDGILICPTQENDDNIEFLKSSGIPFVVLGRRVEDPDVDYVAWDDVQGAKLAINYMLDKGYRKILFLHAPLYISSARDRLQGYRQAFEESRIPFDPDYVVELRDFSSYEALEKAIKEAPEFDAVFTFNDMMAWTAVVVLRTMGYQVPGDVEVMGFDNIQSRFIMPFPMVSVHTPKLSMVIETCGILVERMKNKRRAVGEKAIHKIIETQLCLSTDNFRNYIN